MSGGNKDEMDWLPNLPDDFGTEQWCDAATEIEYRYLQVLQQDFDSDVASLQAYLHRVAQLGALPRLPVQQWAEEDVYEGMEAFVELIDSYPLDLEVLQDKNRVYRRSMVRFCSELLQAKAAFTAGLIEKAWWHLSRVGFHNGWAQGYCLAEKPVEDKRRSGKKGGLAKGANKLQVARNACIEHLKNDCPTGGWMSPCAAIATVVPKVELEIGKVGENVDVKALLFDWLNGDSAVQQAGGFIMRCTKK